jgi:xylulokinase
VADVAHALGIDVGTTNAKVALVDDRGEIVAVASRAIPSQRAEGRAWQDADELWRAVTEAIRSVTAERPGAAADVTTLGVCSQYSSIVPVDEELRPLSELMLYLDQRGTPHCWKIMEEHPDAFDTWIDHHGIPPIGSGLSLGHILFVQHERPEVHEKTAAYLEPMDFVNARLTGTIAATQCTMFTTQLCDNRRLGVTSYDDELVRRSGVDPTKLPPLVAVDGTIGQLERGVAHQLGLPEDTVVHAAMNDSHAGAFATGAFMPRRGGLMIGTTAVLLDALDHKDIDLDHELLSMPSPVADRYLAWAENGIAGKAVEHVLEHIVYAVDALGDHLTDDEFSSLDAAVASVPAGSDGALFLPWLSGSLSPKASSAMRGGFINVSLDTTRTHLVRAMVEGTAFNLGWLLPHVETFTHQPMDEIVLGGGAARSQEWPQILADVLDRPVRTLAQPEFAVARAVARVALTRVGTLSDDDLATGASTQHDFDPRNANRACYDELQEQFIAAFEALRPICEALNR